MIDLAYFLAAAGAEGSGPSGLAERFGLNLGHISIQVLSFAILAFVLYKFGFKPVLATLDKRQAEIQKGLDYAREMEAKLAEAEEERKRRIQEASKEGQDIVAEARRAAEDRIAKAAQDASRQAEDILRRGEQQIEADRRRMLAEAREEIARLVVGTASKVLSRDLSSEERDRFAATAADALAEERA